MHTSHTCVVQGACLEDTLGALPQLKLEQLWKPSRSGFDTDVTLVTQLSLERYALTIATRLSAWALGTCVLLSSACGAFF